MGRRRTIALCRLLLLLLTVMDLGPLRITAGTLPSTSLRRQKKSIMDLQLSSVLPSSSTSEEEDEDDDELEEDDNESGLDEASLRVNSDEDEEDGWSPDTPSRSSFRERQADSLLNPITTTVSKRSAGRRRTLNTFFSEREHEALQKRQKKQYVVVHTKPHMTIGGGPDPRRAHQMLRMVSRRNQNIAQRQSRWHPTPAYKIPSPLEVDEDDDDNAITFIEKKSPLHPYEDNYYVNYYEDNDDNYDDGNDSEEDFGLENSSEDEEKAIDAALKHLSWQRLTKRLIQLEGLQGPYLDRGERSGRRYQRALKKRSSSSSASRNNHESDEKKELEAILSDDNTAVKLKRSYSEATKRVLSQSDHHHHNSNNNDNNNTNKSKSGVNETVIVSKDKTSSKHQQQGKQEVVDRGLSKGKQWVPYDSERTLRSKKSWDQYFGMDKRSVISSQGRRRGPHADTSAPRNRNNLDKDDVDENNEDEEVVVESGEDDDDDRSFNKKKLQDDLIKWYFDKVMLKSELPGVKPLKLEVGKDDDNDDDETEEDKRKKKSVATFDDNRNGNEIWSKRVDERLRHMENALLSGATRLLEKEVENAKKEGSLSKEDRDRTEREVIGHLKAAFSLEKVRDALEDFQETVGEFEGPFEGPSDDVNIGEEEDDKKKKMKKSKSGEPVLKEIKNDGDGDDKKKKKSVMKKKKSMIEPTEMSMAIGPSITNGPRDLSSEVASPVFLSDSIGPDLLFPPCPLVMDALGYCEELSTALGEMGKLLSRSCVKHMLCYTCDKSPGTCNRAFLQEVEDLCDDDFRCQAIAGAMRSVFLSNHDEFRRRNIAFCDVNHCLVRLLQKK